MPKVSVLLPVRNGGAYLQSALDSIERQTWRDLELVVVDDGSTDETPRVLSEFAARDRRVRVMRHEPSGIADALNFGLSLAQGEYVARMDADDIAHPDRLARQVEYLEQNPRVIACGTDFLFIGERYRYARTPKSDGACKATLLLIPCFLHSSVVLRRAVLERERIRYRNEFPYCEDYQLWSDLAPHGAFANLRGPLMQYRLHPKQSSSVHSVLQQSMHVKISVANLRARGVADVDEQALSRFLWPRAQAEPFSRLRYTREALRLMRRYCAITGRDGAWVLAMMCLRLARNLVLKGG